jgi:hypothetical protein
VFEGERGRSAVLALDIGLSIILYRFKYTLPTYSGHAPALAGGVGPILPTHTSPIPPGRFPPADDYACPGSKQRQKFMLFTPDVRQPLPPSPY